MILWGWSYQVTSTMITDKAFARAILFPSCSVFRCISDTTHWNLTVLCFFLKEDLCYALFHYLIVG